MVRCFGRWSGHGAACSQPSVYKRFHTCSVDATQATRLDRPIDNWRSATFASSSRSSSIACSLLCYLALSLFAVWKQSGLTPDS